MEGRRSSDIWLAQGDAVGDKGTVGRALSLLHRQPKLSVLPPTSENDHRDTSGAPRLPSRQNSASRPTSSKAKTTGDTDPDDQRSLPPSLRFSLSLQSSNIWRQHFGQDVEAQQPSREPINVNAIDVSHGDSSYCIVNEAQPDSAEEEILPSHLASSPQNRSFLNSTNAVPDVPKSVTGSKRNSLGTLISALDKELQIPAAASDIDLFDFDPDMEGIAASTPHGTKAQHGHPTENVPELPHKQSARASSVDTVGIVSSNAAPPSLEFGQRNITIQPLVPKPRARKLKPKASKVFDQESATALDGARTAKQDMPPLSLREQEANVGLEDSGASRIVRPLSIKDKGKGREKLAYADHESARAGTPQTSGNS